VINEACQQFGRHKQSFATVDTVAMQSKFSKFQHHPVSFNALPPPASDYRQGVMRCSGLCTPATILDVLIPSPLHQRDAAVLTTISINAALLYDPIPFQHSETVHQDCRSERKYLLIYSLLNFRLPRIKLTTPPAAFPP
jgi:hypothetical protein